MRTALLGGVGRGFHTSLSPLCASFSSEELLSNQSREKCISRIQQLETLRPLDERVKYRAAVLVPLVEISGEAHLLFTRRSLGMSFRSGEVCFPGGKQDPDDLDLTRTALRETEEELGIPSANIDLVHWQLEEVPFLDDAMLASKLGQWVNQ